ncbi:MAG: SPFH domain-containing protein [Anaerolineae bacterium]|nr:SPFH domain-containing protein [Anaerolineae bacterium]
MSPWLGALLGVLLVAFVTFLASIRMVQEYERAVVFRFGRLLKRPKGPGLFLVYPYGIDRIVKIDLRVVTLDIPRQDCITRDNVTVGVNAVAYFQVVDPLRAVVAVNNYHNATFQIAQTSLRSVIGQVELDELLSQREQVNQNLQHIIDAETEPWGVKVSVVEIKDVELPPQMQRAMARQAEAEREKRAKIIHAEGEYQAAQQLHQAAITIAKEPTALQLRYLQTLTEVAVEKNSTIIFPVPIDFLSALTEALGQNNKRPPR